MRKANPARKRGRPAKNTTATAEAKAQPQTPPEAAYKPVAEKTDNQPSELAEAITAALRPIVDELKAHLIICARLAAADTLHSMQQPEFVLGHSIKEGRLAGAILSAQNEIKEN